MSSLWLWTGRHCGQGSLTSVCVKEIELVYPPIEVSHQMRNGTALGYWCETL